MILGPSEADPVQERARRLGAELRRRRLAAGLTQQALADRIGYDRSCLSQVETGALRRSRASVSHFGALRDPVHDPSDPSRDTEDVVEMLNGWQQHITGWVFACVFDVLSRDGAPVQQSGEAKSSATVDQAPDP